MALSHLLSSVGTRDFLYTLISFFRDSSSLPADPSAAVPVSVLSLLISHTRQL